MAGLKLALSLLGLMGCVQAASNEEWATRSIYQVITDRYARPSTATSQCNITLYCGGTYQALIDNLDYIQGMGFTAVQISPVFEQMHGDTPYGEAFHGYWQQNIYSLNPHFGTAQDLKQLSAELHKRDMYLLFDMVANEMAYYIGDKNMTSSTYIDYADFIPFNTSSQYDPYCPLVNFSNQTELVTCWLGYTVVVTPRIKTTDPTIRTTLDTWVKNIMATYNVDGMRVDGAKQIEMSFFPGFVSSAGVYAMGEVDDGSASNTCNYQSITNGMGGLENYPVYYKLLPALTQGRMSELVDMVGKVNSACQKPQYLTTFAENQDQPRFASVDSDLSIAKNAVAFIILADGIPKMYYGQEQHLTGEYSPYNRGPLWPTKYNTSAPLYQLTAKLNGLRNHAISVDSNYVNNLSQVLYTDPATYAARKGSNGAQIISIISNQGSNGGPYQLAVPGVADPGTNMTEIMTCGTALAGTNGTILVNMDKGEPRVLFPTLQMPGSGLCGYEGKSVNSSGSSSGSSGSSSSNSSSKKGGAAELHVSTALTAVVLGLASFILL